MEILAGAQVVAWDCIHLQVHGLHIDFTLKLASSCKCIIKYTHILGQASNHVKGLQDSSRYTNCELRQGPVDLLGSSPEIAVP